MQNNNLSVCSTCCKFHNEYETRNYVNDVYLKYRNLLIKNNDHCIHTLRKY